MARARGLDAELHAAEALLRAPDDAGMARALTHRSGHVVAAAAKAVAAHRREAHLPAVLAALDRLYDDPVERDPQCRGKLACVDVLDQLGHGEGEPFLRAVHHVQLEPVWGGRQDSAPPLRIRAVQALVRLGHHALWRELGALLVDPVGEVRGAAAQILGQLGGERAVLLLRLRLAVGDADTDVLPDYATGLLAAEGAAAVAAVAPLLAHRDRAVAGGAALALGGSRLPEALAPLRAALARCPDRQLARTLVDAIALQRSEAAAEALLGLLAGEDGELARAAAKGLRLYQDRAAIRQRTMAALAQRNDPACSGAYTDP